MNTIFSFILVLGALIFVHEFGHFIFAKMFGVRVLKFSLGFGPKLLGKKVGETEYVLSALPLGGFVKMFGENLDEQQDIAEEERARSFVHKPAYQRFLIVFAGPLFNFLFPVLLFTLLFFMQGVPVSQDSTMIGGVREGSPAAMAGIIQGDRVTAINGQQVTLWKDLLGQVKKSDGAPLLCTIEREGKELQLLITPEKDEVKNIFGEVVESRYMIGVSRSEQLAYDSVGFGDAIIKGAQQTWFYIYLTALGFVKLIQQVVPASEMGGPILIAQMAGEQMRAGWVNLLYFTALLSVNLGILNLLPVPVLDGGHLLFLTIEGIRKKPMEERVQIIAQQFGIALLGGLMIFVFYNDIMRLIG